MELHNYYNKNYMIFEDPERQCLAVIKILEEVIQISGENYMDTMTNHLTLHAWGNSVILVVDAPYVYSYTVL